MYYTKDGTLYYYEKGESTKIQDNYSYEYYSFELCATDVPVMVIPEGSGFFVVKKDKTEKMCIRDSYRACILLRVEKQ